MSTTTLKPNNGDRAANLESIADAFDTLLPDSAATRLNRDQVHTLKAYCNQMRIIADDIRRMYAMRDLLIRAARQLEHPDVPDMVVDPKLTAKQLIDAVSMLPAPNNEPEYRIFVFGEDDTTGTIRDGARLVEQYLYAELEAKKLGVVDDVGNNYNVNILVSLKRQ